MRTRIVIVAALYAGIVAFVVGCTPTGNATPELPGPSGSPHSDRDAEAVRARFVEYVSVSNQVNYSDPESFEAVYDMVTGSRLEFEQSSLGEFHEAGWTTSGASAITKIGEVVVTDNAESAKLTACIDTSELKYFDENGTERKPEGSVPMNTIVVAFERSAPSEEWLVADVEVPPEGKGACLVS